MANTQTPTTLCINVPTENIMPNPLNPRKNDAINTQEIQKIIKQHGWEEPVTAYKESEDSPIYVLLAGHRRLFAAQQVGMEEIPVFVVRKPESSTEEMQRIASLQSGRVNWTPYEWCEYVYNLWLDWGKPERKGFAMEINMKASLVNDYINIMKYYPQDEIESKLEKKELSISTLAALIKWIRALKKHKPSMVEMLGEDMIRKTMMKKILNKRVTRDDLRNIYYPKMVASQDIQKFLTSNDMYLKDQIESLKIYSRENDFRGNMVSVGHFRKRLLNFKTNNPEQREKALEKLTELQELLNKQIDEIKKQEEESHQNVIKHFS